MELAVGGIDKGWECYWPDCENCGRKILHEEKSFCKNCKTFQKEGGWRWFRKSKSHTKNSISSDADW